MRPEAGKGGAGEGRQLDVIGVGGGGSHIGGIPDSGASYATNGSGLSLSTPAGPSRDPAATADYDKARAMTEAIPIYRRR